VLTQFAVQLAGVVLNEPEQVQLYWPADDVTEDAEPGLQRFALGGMLKDCVLALPQDGTMVLVKLIDWPTLVATKLTSVQSSVTL
jgi:hypothetical protein